ncbi:hypothetical protein CSKR_109006 [Clonorchis sinensis]|uniref:Uncharacterized protein n=1 Tax=Clonorchis sinensis TaxID=79923 RepID=A0A419PV20_CLOSI|nr:hypothetical protein CSKR_109006 [Clonorchis sinensis]
MALQGTSNLPRKLRVGMPNGGESRASMEDTHMVREESLAMLQMFGGGLQFVAPGSYIGSDENPITGGEIILHYSSWYTYVFHYHPSSLENVAGSMSDIDQALDAPRTESKEADTDDDDDDTDDGDCADENANDDDDNKEDDDLEYDDGIE